MLVFVQPSAEGLSPDRMAAIEKLSSHLAQAYLYQTSQQKEPSNTPAGEASVPEASSSNVSQLQRLTAVLQLFPSF